LTSARRVRDRQLMRAARKIITIVLLAQVAWSLPLAIVMSFVDRAFLVGFGLVPLIVVGVLLVFMLHWQRVDARRDALLSRGLRVPALLVSSRATNTRINRRIVQAHTFESRSAGQVIRAEARAFVHLPVGAEATIAYDSDDPTKAIVVEDLDATAAEGQVDWQTLKARGTDRMFRDPS
jgi:hypothetical protein